MKTSALTFKRNEENIKYIPTWCIVLAMISIFAVAILGVMFLISLIKGDFASAGFKFCLIAALLVYGIACDNMEWLHNVRYSFDNRSFHYIYDLDTRLLPTNSTKVDIKVLEIESYKECKNGDFKVVGKFEKRAPMTKMQELKKIKFKNIPEHHDEIKAKLDEWVRK